jgi:rhodanese-related sulfurtransferase
VPGGQLVQNVDRYLVTRNATTVLVDVDGVRAPTAAAWLRRMGFAKVCAYRAPPAELSTRGDAPRAEPSLGALEPARCAELMRSGQAVMVDARPSVAYRRAHAAGAWFLSRASIEQDVRRLPESPELVLVGDDDGYVSLLARDLVRLGKKVHALAGGLPAWVAARLPTEAGLARLASAPDDAFLDPEDFDDPSVADREGRAYLDWEVALVHQLAGDPAAPYA